MASFLRKLFTAFFLFFDFQAMKLTKYFQVFCSAFLVFSFNAIATEGVPSLRKAKVEVKAQLPVDASEEESDPVDSSALVAYQVLLAEIALQRSDAVLASRLYTDLALRSADLAALERAVDLALFTDRYDEAVDVLFTWLKLDPTSKKAQQLMIRTMIQRNAFDDLAPNIILLLESEPASLAENLLGLNRLFVRSPDRLAVYRVIDSVCQHFPDVAEAHFALALAAGSAGANERAQGEINKALALKPDFENAALVKIQYLIRQSPTDAIQFMKAYLKNNSSSWETQWEIELQLARLLISERSYAESKKHFDQLLKVYPDSPEVLYPAAILALQQNDKARAETYLKHMISLDISDKNSAYFYLGKLAEDKGSGNVLPPELIQEATRYYTSVVSGEHYLDAQIRKARLLSLSGRLDLARRHLSGIKTKSNEERIRLAIVEAGMLREADDAEGAFKFLESVFIANPNNLDLLYETSLLAEKIDRMDILETRLRRLIALHPESSLAYNALGYSYADRNNRLDEARQLIEEAHRLSPDDFFILDSMGWVLYRQGEFEKALIYLERAFLQRDDPEIACHMIEVLWALGRKTEAQKILQNALKKEPANTLLQAIAQKYAL